MFKWLCSSLKRTICALPSPRGVSGFSAALCCLGAFACSRVASNLYEGSTSANANFDSSLEQCESFQSIQALLKEYNKSSESRSSDPLEVIGALHRKHPKHTDSVGGLIFESFSAPIPNLVISPSNPRQYLLWSQTIGTGANAQHRLEALFAASRPTHCEGEAPRIPVEVIAFCPEPKGRTDELPFRFLTLEASPQHQWKPFSDEAQNARCRTCHQGKPIVNGYPLWPFWYGRSHLDFLIATSAKHSRMSIHRAESNLVQQLDSKYISPRQPAELDAAHARLNDGYAHIGLHHYWRWLYDFVSTHSTEPGIASTILNRTAWTSTISVGDAVTWLSNRFPSLLETDHAKQNLQSQLIPQVNRLRDLEHGTETIIRALMQRSQRILFPGSAEITAEELAKVQPKEGARPSAALVGLMLLAHRSPIEEMLKISTARYPKNILEEALQAYEEQDPTERRDEVAHARSTLADLARVEHSEDHPRSFVTLPLITDKNAAPFP